MSSASPTGGTLPMPSKAYQSLVVLFPSDCSAAVETPHMKPAGKAIGGGTFGEEGQAARETARAAQSVESAWAPPCRSGG